MVELPPNKAIESAVEAEEKVRRIIETNLDIRRDDFDCELDKVQRLQLNNNLSDKKSYHPNFQISYVNLEHTDLGICFADSHGNLKIKIFYNKNVSYDSFQSFLEAPDKKLSNH